MDGYYNPKTFELDWSNGQTLKVFEIEGENSDLILEAPLHQTIQIRDMSVSTGSGSEGNWKVEFHDPDEP